MPYHLSKRIFDICGAALGLIVASPIMLLAALGVFLSDPGPVIYKGKRLGKDGHPFLIYKFRTMRIRNRATESAITARNDSRIFRFGHLLRLSKVDELPQLFNILKGDMSIVGPRPEDEGIANAHYSPRDWETLRVKPGLTSPGTVYYYTDLERRLSGEEESESQYIRQVLPAKLALDHVYIEKASFLYDLTIVFRTVVAIVGVVLGRVEFAEPPELRGPGRKIEE